MKKLAAVVLMLGATSLVSACSGDPARQQIDAANQKAADAAARADQAAKSAQEAAEAAKAAEAAAEAAADKVARMNNSGMRK
jgi:hypothetical protein